MYFRLWPPGRVRGSVFELTFDEIGPPARVSSRRILGKPGSGQFQSLKRRAFRAGNDRSQDTAGMAERPHAATNIENGRSMKLGANYWRAGPNHGCWCSVARSGGADRLQFATDFGTADR